MDWSKAKNIILVLLILLNIFLFINVMNVKNSFIVTGQYQRSAKQALEAAGVIVTGTIPNSDEPLNRISYIEKEPKEFQKIINMLTEKDYSDASYSENPIFENEGKTLRLNKDTFNYTDKTGMTTFDVEDEKKTNKQILSWIKKNGLESKDFSLNSYVREGNSTTVEYIQKYNGMPLFSNKIIFSIEDGMLIRVEGSIKVFYNIKLSKQKDEIVSPNIILLTNQDKVKGVISSIVLGYLRPKDEELFDIPIWQINFHSGAETYFNAYTGEWIDLPQ